MNVIYSIALVFIALPFQIFCAEGAPTPLDSLLTNRALIKAVEQCNESEAKRLIDKNGADPNQKVLVDTRISFGEIVPTNGQPYIMPLPLLDHLLVRFEHDPQRREASIGLLLALGGRANYRNIFDRTPLFYAPTPALAQLFLDHGCNNLNYSDQCGRRALHEAMKHGRGDVVQTLLAPGANPTVHDNAQCTPLDLIFHSRLRNHKLCRALVCEGPPERWFSEVPCMKKLPEDFQLRIMDFIPIGTSLLSKPVQPSATDFADSYIQETVDQ